MVLELCEMPSVSSRNWTRVAVSISYVDNNYITVEYMAASLQRVKPQQVSWIWSKQSYGEASVI